VDIAAVLFDVDGTLVDHDRAASTALVRALDATATQADPSDAVRCWQQLESVAMGRYLAGELTFTEQRRLRATGFAERFGLGTWDDVQADAWFAGYLGHYEDAWQTYDDVGPALAALATRYPDLTLGVLTNGDAEQQRRKLRRTDLAGMFDLVIASSEAGVAKPDPAIFRQACARLGLAPTLVAYVGDRLTTDAAAATDAGLHGIWLNRTGDPTPTHLPTITTLVDLVPRVSSQ
jgi:putative hydrolase of the HAD superfamily